MIKILIVEDDTNGMGKMLVERIGFLRSHFQRAEISLVETLADARRVLLIYPRPDMIVLDLGLPDSLWEETVAAAPELDSKSPVVIVTGHPEDQVRALLKCPEVEIIMKDPSLWDHLIAAVARALFRGFSRSRKQVDENLSRLAELIPGNVPPI